MKKKNRSYNVRLVVDTNGKIKLGFVWGCYSVNKKLSEWRDVPKSIREKLAVTIGAELI